MTVCLNYDIEMLLNFLLLGETTSVSRRAVPTYPLSEAKNTPHRRPVCRGELTQLTLSPELPRPPTGHRTGGGTTSVLETTDPTDTLSGAKNTPAEEDHAVYHGELTH